MKINLNPCPFCGGAKIEREFDESETERAVCQLCGASGPTIMCGMNWKEEWNRRPAVSGKGK